jgi:hypothetical protein
MRHAPRDTFFARGAMGQFVIVVPSRRPIIAHFDVCPCIAKVDELVGDVVAALARA